MQNSYTFQNLSQQPCHHLVTQKEPNSPYSFSLALHTQEEPQQILANRERLKKQFPTMKFIVANQTHSDNITIISEPKEIGWHSLEDAIEDCDALITNQKNIMLTILTADCVPILLLDPITNVIAVVHAGWKGTQQEIVLKTIQKMQKEFNVNPQTILAGIAPSIGKCCYEVEWNVAQHFANIEGAYSQKEDKYQLDLPHINHHQLLQAGLKVENIECSNICTACQVEHYFSYRNEQGCSGRFMSMIGLSS